MIKAETIGRPWLIICAGMCIMGFGSGTASANGFKILGIKSAKATAMGEAFVAQANDPSAVSFNPAGITQLKGTQIQGALTITNGWIEHTSPSGITEKNEDSWQTVPALYATTNFGTDVFAVGLGVSVPNGLASEWSRTSLVRYVATYSNLTVVDVNPVVAITPSEHFSFALGVSSYHSEAILESLLDNGMLVAQPGMLDGQSRLNASGRGWGYNVGMLYNVNDRQRIGLTYKSPFQIHYQGNASFGTLGGPLSSGAEADIRFPQVVVVGYAMQPSADWTVEADVEWTDWETFNDLKVNISDPALPDAVYLYNLESAFTYKLGIEHQLNEQWAVRCGYIYNQNATPESTFRPSLPDTDTQFFSLGTGYNRGNWTIDTALVAIFYKDRAIDNDVDSRVGGTYENFALDFSVGVTYRF